MKQTNLQKNIMRRVYYSYALSIVSQGLFWQGMFLVIAVWLLAGWLHVASIINNFLSVPVGDAPQFVWGALVNAIANGELLTALTLLLAGGAAVSVSYHVARVFSPIMKYSIDPVFTRS